MEHQAVPAELARLWRLPTQARLGRPAGLDVEAVVRAAAGLADRDGLAGVTLAKVAKELGVTAMSLYRHVGSKDELVALMADFAFGAPPLLGADPGGWREGLHHWAYAQRASYIRHPWLADVPFTGPPSGPNAIGWMDAALRVLRGTGLDWGAKLGIQIVLAGFVRHTSIAAQQMAEGRRGSGLNQVEVERGYGRVMAGLVDPERFPDAGQLFASRFFESLPDPTDAAAPDPDFAFGLELILDGAAAAITAAGQPEGADRA